jgi:hypothetical protein
VCRRSVMADVQQIARFNRNVLLCAVAVVALCAYQLLFAAYETGNWRGAWFSLAHVVIVAFGAVLALRENR